MLLVTGATGNIGRELVHELDERGTPVRALVRDPARAVGLPAGVELAVADLGEPETLPAAFAGVDRLFLLTQGIDTVFTRNALAAATAAGVRHIVALSSAHVLYDPMPAMAQWHHDREQLVRASGIPSTVLRPGGFMSNALDWVPTIRDGGFVLDPVGPGRSAPIDPADIAAVAALAMTEDGYADQAFTLTGNEALTVAEMVRTLAAATGTDIETREPAGPAEAVGFRFPAGAPAALAAAFTEGLARMRADTVGFRTDTVEHLLGRPPRTFADWCARHADAFRPGDLRVTTTAAAHH